MILRTDEIIQICYFSLPIVRKPLYIYCRLVEIETLITDIMKYISQNTNQVTTNFITFNTLVPKRSIQSQTTISNIFDTVGWALSVPNWCRCLKWTHQTNSSWYCRCQPTSEDSKFGWKICSISKEIELNCREPTAKIERIKPCVSLQEWTFWFLLLKTRGYGSIRSMVSGWWKARTSLHEIRSILVEILFEKTRL